MSQFLYFYVNCTDTKKDLKLYTTFFKKFRMAVK